MVVEPMCVKGVNVIGSFHGQFGMGEVGRQLIASLKTLEIPFVLISEAASSELLNDPLLPYYVNEPVYDTNIFCVTLHLYFRFFEPKIRRIMKNRYNITSCFWESSLVSKEMKRYLALFDEVWVTTAYIKESLSQDVRIPIYHIPQSVQLKIMPAKSNKASFGLADHFTFLFCFDFCSFVERKNPAAVIQAFRKAFPKRSDVQLVIKSHNGHQMPEILHTLVEKCENDPRIHVRDELIPLSKLYELMNTCDCYVSLHRSEGFGLTMAESMCMEKPVIATRYSGNLDFMNEGNSYLCDYRLVPVGHIRNSPYPPKSQWADVDVDQAASLMEYVMKNPEEARRRARKGKQDLVDYHSHEVVSNAVFNRLLAIHLDFTCKDYQERQSKIELLSRIYFGKRVVRKVCRIITKLYSTIRNFFKMQLELQ